MIMFLEKYIYCKTFEGTLVEGASTEFIKKKQACFLASQPLVIRNRIVEVAIHDGK